MTADQLDADWQRSLATAQHRFLEHDGEPDQETLEAAAWLHLRIEQGWLPQQGITVEGARRLLEALYRGALTARINVHARIVFHEPSGTEVLQ
jgi:hypothetical protein